MSSLSHHLLRLTEIFLFLTELNQRTVYSLHNKKKGFSYDSAQGIFGTKIMNIIFVAWYNCV